MPDIFDEVEEDLRAERMQAFLRRYGIALAALVVLLIGCVAGWQAWLWYQGKRDAAAAAAYLSAMENADTLGLNATPAARDKAADAFLQVAATAPEGYRVLAALRAAALKADGEQLPQALSLWTQVAASPGADPVLRDLASLLWVQHQIDRNDLGGDPGTLESRLKPLETADNPWHPLAQETQAMLDLRLGRTDAARAVLKALAADPTAAPGVRARAAGLLERLGA